MAGTWSAKDPPTPFGPNILRPRPSVSINPWHQHLRRGRTHGIPTPHCRNSFRSEVRRGTASAMTRNVCGETSGAAHNRAYNWIVRREGMFGSGKCAQTRHWHRLPIGGRPARPQRGPQTRCPTSPIARDRPSGPRSVGVRDTEYGDGGRPRSTKSLCGRCAAAKPSLSDPHRPHFPLSDCTRQRAVRGPRTAGAAHVPHVARASLRSAAANNARRPFFFSSRHTMTVRDRQRKRKRDEAATAQRTDRRCASPKEAPTRTAGPPYLCAAFC